MARKCACDLCREDPLECCRGGLFNVPAGPGVQIPDDDEDRISALPDDMLLQILTRLRCARGAAHTSLLARRWRGLWTRLPELVFHGTRPNELEAALALVARPAPSLLDINILICYRRNLEPARVSSLLRAAAALAPVELVVHISADYRFDAIELPCFVRTTSIKLEARFVTFTLPPAGGFMALESLHLEDCLIDLTDLLPRCTSLRKLWIINWNSESVAVSSPSLKELVVYAPWIQRIDIFGPVLKTLHLNAYRGIYNDFSLSYSAPTVEDLCWKRECKAISRFGVLWRMWSMTLTAKLQPLEHTQLAETSESTCSMLQERPLIRALSLWMETNVLSVDVSKTFKQEISQFLVTDFSVLELDLTPCGHVYGDMILHLLGNYTSIQKLAVILDSFMMDRGNTCHGNCHCDQRSNWRRQTIPLTDLKEVQILGFEGKDHEIDFLKVLLRCAAMLETVTLRFSKEVPPSDKECLKIRNILEAYPSVECKIYRKFERRFYRYDMGFCLP